MRSHMTLNDVKINRGALQPDWTSVTSRFQHLSDILHVIMLLLQFLGRIRYFVKVLIETNVNIGYKFN